MNTRLLLMILSLVTCTRFAAAQEWTARYGSAAGVPDECARMVTANERVYLTGATFGAAGDWNIVTLCLDRTGATIWEEEYGTGGDEKAASIAVDGNGNTYVLGSVFESDMRWHAILLKYDPMGVLQWSKVFTSSATSSDIPVDLAVLSNGSILVASASTMPDASVVSVVTAFDDDADQLWSDTYAGNGNAWPMSIAGGSHAAVAGSTGGGSDGDAFVIRFNADGTRAWANIYDGGSGHSEVFSQVAFDSQGTILCAGWTETGTASSEVLFVQYNAAGTMTDSEAYTPGTDGRHRATAVNADMHDNPLLAARIDAGGGDFNMYLNRRGPDAWQRIHAPSGGAAGDQSAPSFRGASTAFASGDGQLTVVWHSAQDNLAMRDELSYNVYVATSSGGQNFSTPTTVIHGATKAVIGGLLPGETYYVVVRAVDFSMNEDLNARESSVHLDLPPLRVVTSSLPDATPGTAYSTVLTAEGGTPPYRWSLMSGALPPGVSFAEDGSISGTPLDDGTSPLVVRVHDASGDSADAQLDLVSVTPPALDVQADLTLPGGEYWYSTVTVASSATLTLSGNVVIHAVDAVRIDGVVLGLCAVIELRTTESFTLDGSMSNVCTPPAADPPDIRIVADGELKIGSSPSPDPAIISDGDIMITDTFTEDADLTPISLEEIRSGGVTAETAHAASAQVARAGRAGVNRPAQARRGGTTSVARDGDIDVNVNMNAANGADAGGGTVVGGNGGTLSFASRNGTLTFAAGTVLSAGDGGKGASVVATGCPAVADASASKGGRGGSILVGGNSVVFGAGVVLNRGNGGMGGDATATADAAPGPCANGCDATATSGPGGEMGGIGYVLTLPGAGIVGAPTEGGGNGGKGGKATATASNGTDCPTCPGGKGGDGGTATATGGKGGNGATGNIWPIAAGSHKAGDGGDAEATGGKGGKGANCCTPPVPGGDGGSGKSATATGGDPGTKGKNPGVPGTYTAQGGSAGAGGDGKGPGAAGGVGDGTGVGTAGTEADGTPANGGVFCFNIHFWFIYFSTLPDGFITPGIPMKLKACPTQDVNSQEAEAEVSFLTYDENGGNDVMYQKQNDDVIIVSGGLKINPAGTDHPQFPGATWWSGGLQLQFMLMNPSQSGQVAIHGLDAQGLVIGQTVVQVGPSSPPVASVALQAPQGTVYHQVVVRTTVPIRFNHWWMAGWFIDP